MSGLALVPILTLVLSVVIAFCGRGSAQDVQSPGLQPAAIPDASELNQTVRKYEQFLASRPPGSDRSALAGARTQLATAYFLLHRYGDSLAALRPLASGKSRMSAQAWSIKGLDELETNQLAGAIMSLRRALAANPSSATARLALGDALARSNRMEDAARQYEEQTRLTPSLPDAWFKLGLTHSQLSAELSRSPVRQEAQAIEQQLIAEELLAKGDNLNAARLLFRIVRGSPRQPEVHATLATALLALGYVKAARDHFRQELVANPESPSAKLGLIETSALSGDWRDVGNGIEDLSRSQPFEFTRLLEFPPAGLVLNTWNGGRMKPPEWFTSSDVGNLWRTWVSSSEAIAQFRAPAHASSMNGCAGNPPRASAALGVWLPETCYDYLEKRLRTSKELSFAERTKLAEAEYRLGHYESALKTARLLHASLPGSGWGIYWLTKAHDALAEECFFKVGELNPNSARVHQMLAEHYTRLSDYAKAKAEYENAIRFAPESPEVHLGLGTVFSRTGNFEDAERELHKTLELAPESDFAHYELGHVYVHQGMWESAVAELRQVPASSTEWLSARLDLSQAEAETNRTETAIQDLLSVAGLDHDGEVYFRLASLYRKAGDDAHAREALAKFKEMRARSLEADKDELSALENEQASAAADSP